MANDEEGCDDTMPASDAVAPTRVGHAPPGSTPPAPRPLVAVHAGARPDYAELVEIDPAHYVIGDEIARGGMGRILTARDRRLGRPVALKELLVGSSELRARFEREARITAGLQHPAIVNVLEAGTWPGGEPFYVMKLVTGESLDKVVARRPTLEARLALVPNVIAAVDALAYAHSRRIIHRDLKPANVLVGEFGETVVIDWGLAKNLDDHGDGPDVAAANPRRARSVDAADTVAGSVMGTPSYMPAEQALGGAVDERADVYALGAMLYHVLAGVPPYVGKTTTEILERVIAGPPQPLAERVPTLPADLVAVVAKAMAHAAGDRYASANELAIDLKRFQTGQLVGAHDYTTVERLRRWVRRHRAVTIVATTATVVLAGYGGWSIQQIVAARTRADAARDTAIAGRKEADAQRQEATAQRAEAIANGNRALLVQARAALELDPAEALAWLAQMAPDGPGWDAARVLAAAAKASPAPSLIFRGIPASGGYEIINHIRFEYPGDLSIARDQRHVLVAGKATWFGDLETGRAFTIPASTLAGPVLCDDGKRAVGWRGVADGSGGWTGVLVELDLATMGVTTHPGAWTDVEAAQARCARSAGLVRRGPRAAAWDAAHEVFRDVGTPTTVIWDAWLSHDAAHVLSIEDHVLRRRAITDLHVEGEAAVDLEGERGDSDSNRPPQLSESDDGSIVVVDAPHARIIDLGGGTRSARLAPDVDGAVVSRDGLVVVVTRGGTPRVQSISPLAASWIAGAAPGDLSCPSGWNPPHELGLPTSVLGVGRVVTTEDVPAATGVRRFQQVERLSTLAPDRGWLLDGRHVCETRPSGMTRTLRARAHDPMHVARVMDDGRVITLGTDLALRVWAPFADTQYRALAPAERAWLSRDGRWLVALRADGLHRIDLAATATATASDEVAPRPSSDVITVGLGGDVVWASQDRVWRWRPGAAPVELGSHLTAAHADALRGPLVVAITADGVAVSYAPGTLVVWRADRPYVTVIPGAEGGVGFSYDGTMLATRSSDGGLWIWATATATARPAIATAVPGDPVFSRDGRHVLIRGHETGAIVDIASGRSEPVEAALGTTLDGAQLSDDGSQMMLRGVQGGAVLRSIRGHEDRLITNGTFRDVLDVRLAGDRVVVATAAGVLTVRDDLPTEPAALAVAIRALSYRLIDDPAHPGTLVVTTEPR